MHKVVITFPDLKHIPSGFFKTQEAEIAKLKKENERLNDIVATTCREARISGKALKSFLFLINHFGPTIAKSKVIIVIICWEIPYLDLTANGTIEERVAVLEVQMDDLQGDVSQTEEEITLLFSQQVIQDERLINLEEDTSSVEGNVEGK